MDFFLVNKNFIKSVPREMKEIVSRKILSFTETLRKNENSLYDLPSGYWIKKINSSGKDFYEFRINSGDRIIFDIVKGHSNKSILRYCYFSTHDRAVEKYNKMLLNNFEDLEIEKEESTSISEELFHENFFLDNYHTSIDYKVEKEEFFKDLLEKEDTNLLSYLYLNEEQYNCLKVNTPAIINGGAGSGKTAILFNKMLNLHRENSNDLSLGYFTLNNKLQENIKSIMKEIIEENSSMKFLSIKEFFLKYLNIDSSQVITFFDFKKIYSLYNSTNKKRKKYKIEIEQLYSEINGILKGMMFKNICNNWERDLNNPLISLEEYLNLSDEFSIFTEEFKNEIYDIAIFYENWLKENKKYDLNDIARLFLKSHTTLKIFDYIFLDEVQDLTEIQIYALNSLCKNFKNIYFAGDIHQVVTMNYFNFSRILDLHKNNNILFLSNNYRSKSKIIDIANRVKELRKKYIGHQKIEYEQLENSISSGGRFILQKNNMEFIRETSKDANFIIVVPNNMEKNNLLKELNDNSQFKDMIFTVEEAKGLEFKSVVCYNLTSPFLKEWNCILNNQVKKDQTYRYYFNLLYVGFTRAKSEVILMESQLQNNKIVKLFENFSEKNSNISSLIKESTREEWLEKAEQLKNMGRFEEALISSQKAQKKIKKIEINNSKENPQETKNISSENKFKRESFEKAVFENNYKLIKEFLENDFNGDFIIDNKILERNIKSKEIRLGGELTPLMAATYLNYIEIAKLLINNGVNINFQNKLNKTALFYGVMNNSIETIEFLLNNGANPDFQDNLGNTALFYALKKNRKDIIKLLIDKEANINLEDNLGNTLMTYAYEARDEEIIKLLIHGNLDLTKESNKIAFIYGAVNNSFEIIETLLDKGIDINLKNNLGYTALFYAVSLNYERLTKLLLSKGANCNIKNGDKDTPLMCACKFPNEELVEILIDHGAEVDIKDAEGCDPLFLSVGFKNKQIIKKILEAGGKKNIDYINSLKGTPLMKALAKKDIEDIKILLENGASINYGNQIPVTPLRYSLHEYDLSIIELLLNYGADVNQIDSEGNLLLISASSYNDKKLIEYLLNKGADVSKEDKYKTNIIMDTVLTQKFSMTDFLLEKGISIDLPNSNGQTALFCQYFKNFRICLKYLFDKGANINWQDNGGNTPLMTFVYNGLLRETEFLLEYKPNINLQNMNGFTPLMEAINKRNTKIAQLLLKYNPDINLQNKFGQTALMLACETNNSEIIKLLLEKKADINLTDDKGLTAFDYIKNKNVIKIFEKYNS